MLERAVAALESIAATLIVIAKSLAGATVKSETPAKPKGKDAQAETPAAPAAPAAKSLDDDLGFGSSEKPKTYTQEEVFNITKGIAQTKGRDVVKSVMTEFKITAMDDLKPESFAAFVAKLQA